MLSVLIWDFNVFKVYKLCIGWNNKISIESTRTVHPVKKKRKNNIFPENGSSEAHCGLLGYSMIDGYEDFE